MFLDTASIRSNGATESRSPRLRVQNNTYVYPLYDPEMFPGTDGGATAVTTPFSDDTGRFARHRRNTLRKETGRVDVLIDGYWRRKVLSERNGG